MGKPRFYDTNNIKFKLGDVVECIYHDKHPIHIITAVRVEKVDNGCTMVMYQIDEDGDSWYPTGAFRLFIDPSTVNNIANWLNGKLGKSISVDGAEPISTEQLLDKLRAEFIPVNDEDD